MKHFNLNTPPVGMFQWESPKISSKESTHKIKWQFSPMIIVDQCHTTRTLSLLQVHDICITYRRSIHFGCL